MEKLNALRKQKIRAVILLEAVVALAIFASIATLLLGQIQKNRQEEAKILQKEEVLRVAKMALQTGQNQVNINGVEIQVSLINQMLQLITIFLFFFFFLFTTICI